jgi:hypothetical protein
VWTAFFEMFDEVHLSGIQIEEIASGQAVGSAHMIARGGSSEIPIGRLLLRLERRASDVHGRQAGPNGRSIRARRPARGSALRPVPGLQRCS